MTQIKSQIVKNVPTTLTAAYTNATTNGATLKAVNAVGIADPNVWTVTTNPAGNDDWSFFGRPTNTFVESSSANGAYGTPYPVRLDTDRVLLMWLPHHQHTGGGLDVLGGTIIHTQIVRWNGSSYQCGPIINVALSVAAFPIAASIWRSPAGMANNNQSSLRAVAITSTKVAVGIRTGGFFQLLRINISGNAVNSAATTSLDLTTAGTFNTTNNTAFEVVRVPGNTDKVIVGGAGASNWVLQAYNFPDAGIISNASSLYSTGLAVTTGSFTISPLTKNAISGVATYIVAANTSTVTTVSLQNFSFTDSTNTFAAVGTAVTIATAETHGLEAACLSTGNSPNAVVAFINASNFGFVSFARQLSLTQAANSVTSTIALGNVNTKGLKVAHQLGDEKVVFVGETNTAVSYNSAGISENLIPATLSANTTVHLTQFYPFDSRPLFSAYDNNVTIPNRVAQLFAMTGGTATTMGTLSLTGNYFPYRHPYGGHYAWSEQAQCWMVGYGGRIYALDTAGVILSELPIFQLDAQFNHLANIKQLVVTPAGRIVGLTDAFGADPTSWYGARWDNASVGSYGFATAPVLTAAGLAKARRVNAAAIQAWTSTYDLVIDLVAEANTERVYGTYVNMSTNAFVAVVRWDGTTWTSLTPSTGVGAAAIGAHNIGVRPSIRLIQESPEGLWRFIGASGLNSAINMAYQGIQSGAFLIDTASGSMNTSTGINTTTLSTYAITRQSSTNMTSLAFYNPNDTSIRAFFSVEGRITNPLFTGLTITTPNTGQFMNIVTTKYGSTVAPCNTSNLSAVTTAIYTFDSISPGQTIKYTQTSGSGFGWTTLAQMSQFSWKIFATSISTAYQVVGIDTTRFAVTLSGDSNDFFITPITGVSLLTNTSYRVNDTYLIPPGYSIKLRSTHPNSLDCLLTIVEE